MTISYGRCICKRCFAKGYPYRIMHEPLYTPVYPKYITDMLYMYPYILTRMKEEGGKV